MKIIHAIRDFFFPPVCPACREVFAANYGERNELCSDCEYKWELERSYICASCGERFADCKCMPPALERAKVTALLKLVPYGTRHRTVQNTVLYIKRRRDGRVFSFLSRELTKNLNKYIEKLGLRREDAVIAYCPRRRSAVNSVGFDQARLLAEGISRQTGIGVIHAIKRRSGFGQAQKKLGAAGRKKNVKGAFALKRRADVKNKTVFLVDDLVTTGSTMGECARLLKKAGAALVIGVCVAYTEKAE